MLNKLVKPQKTHSCNPVSVTSTRVLVHAVSSIAVKGSFCLQIELPLAACLPPASATESAQ